MPFQLLRRSSFARATQTSAAAAVLALLCLTADAGAATFTVDRVVTDAGDASVGDGACVALSGGGCTLRAAVQEANFSTAADTIVLPSGQTALLTLGTAGTSSAATGDLDVTHDLTVLASGATPAAIDGGDVDRIFDVPDVSPQPNIKLTLDSIELRNGKVTGEPGGAIRTQGTLTATGVRVTSSDSVKKTAAPAVDGLGGAISGGATSIVTLSRSRIDANSATAGGALSVFGTTSVDATTIDGNSARAGESGSGGGVDNGGVLSIVNSTIANNADHGNNGGGGLITQAAGSGGAVTIAFSTIAGNTSGLGSAVRNLGGAGSVVKVSSSLVIGDCNGPTLTSDVQHHNVGGGVSCGLNDATDAPNATPTLGALAANGGPTPTMALVAGAGVDGVDDVPAANCASNVDQRGGRRPFGGACDVGAFEVGSLADLSLTGTVAPGSVVAGSNITYAYQVAAAGPDAATGVVVTDPLPASVSFVSASTSAGSCTGPATASGGTVACALGAVAIGSPQTVTVVVRPNAADPALVNTATVASDQNDLTANNSVSLVAAVTAAPVTSPPPPPPCGTPGAEACPVIGASGVSLTGLRARPSRFRTTGGKAAKRGTALEFQLSSAAKVTFTVSGPVTRKRVCKGHGRSRRCRTVTKSPVVGTFETAGTAGSNTTRFSGLIKRRALKPGSYRIAAQAQSGAERSKTSTIAVTVIR